MSNEIIFLSDVRISFPNIATPQTQQYNDNGVAKTRVSYNAEFLMPMDHPGFAQFFKQYQALATAKWAENANVVMQRIQAERKLRCFGQGEEKVNQKTFKPYDGYPGNIYLTAGRDTMPQIIKPDGSPVDPSNTMEAQALARKIYGGCRVNAAVKPWIQANKYGNGVRLDLVAVQFLRDDTAFGEGAADASGLFGAVAAVAAAPAMPGFMAAPAPQMPAAPFGQAVTGGLPPFMQGR